ncbi:hypothetical protein EMPS_04064 [Entomortierella parvispora]|uniref:Protein kinase domain-containing protein n=1 Tax=Entomortierella parvispora TaxID=205924 RepID=A0A9P3LV64_9FUNG|nr:hypothetical protein EMPS_04064 [Entomortierella parvispora]
MVTKLLCLVEGDFQKNAFFVDVEPTWSIAKLRDEINPKISRPSDNVLAKDLALWSVSIPYDLANKQKRIFLGENSTELDPIATLSQALPLEMSENSIRIIVQRPQSDSSAQGSQGTLPDHISEFDLVHTLPPDTTFRGNDRTDPPSSWSSSAASPHSVRLWNNFFEEILNVHLDEIPRYSRPSFPTDRDYWLEEGLHELLRGDLRCLSVMPPHSSLIKVGSVHVSFGQPGVGKPDLICRALDENGLEIYLFPVEMKKPSVLASLDLVADYSRGDIRAVHPLGQEYGYQWANGYRYGMLSTHEQSWFMKRVGRNYDELLVSPAIAINDNDPTFLRTFLCFTRLVSADPHRELNRPNSSQQKKMRANEERKHYKKEDKDSKYNPPGKKGGTGALKNIFRGVQTRMSSRTTEFQLPPYDILEVMSYDNDGAQVLRVLCMGHDIVVKKCDLHNEQEVAKALQHEAMIYEELQGLQGRLIPHVAFAGVSYGVEMVLATEFVGENISRKILSGPDRNKIRGALKEIHRHGVAHGDVRRQNIVVKQEGRHSRFSFIDFGRSFLTEDQAVMQHEMEVLESLLN